MEAVADVDAVLQGQWVPSALNLDRAVDRLLRKKVHALTNGSGGKRKRVKTEPVGFEAEPQSSVAVAAF